jgi:hypothetical protein
MDNAMHAGNVLGLQYLSSKREWILLIVGGIIPLCEQRSYVSKTTHASHGRWKVLQTKDTSHESHRWSETTSSTQPIHQFAQLAPQAG